MKNNIKKYKKWIVCLILGLFFFETLGCGQSNPVGDGGDAADISSKYSCYVSDLQDIQDTDLVIDWDQTIEEKLSGSVKGVTSDELGNMYVYGVENGAFFYADVLNLNYEYIDIPSDINLNSDFVFSITTDNKYCVANREEAFIFDGIDIYKVSFSDIDYIFDDLYKAICIKSGGFAIYGICDGEPTLIKIDKNKSSTDKRKKELSILAGFDPMLYRAVLKYNRSNSEYRIIWIRPDLSNGYDNFLDKLSVDISTGNGPDIISLNYIDPEPFATSGALVCLDSIVKVGDDNYIESVFETSKINNKYYGVPYAASIHTMVTSDSLNKGSSYSLSQFMDLIEQSDYRYVADLTAEDIVLYFGIYNSDDNKFIDYEGRKCNFSDKDFIRLLYFSKEYGVSEDEKYGAGIRKAILAGKAACKMSYRMDCYEIKTNSAYFSGNPYYIGFPSDGNAISYVISGSMLGINSSSDNVEAAKDFLSWLISYEGQECLYEYELKESHGLMFSIPLRGDILEKQIEAFNLYNDNAYVEADANGTTYVSNPIQGSDGVVTILPEKMSEEEIETLKRIIDNSVPVRPETNKIAEIIEEEMGAFLAGDKSAEETAKIIDSRVQVYLDEK